MKMRKIPKSLCSVLLCFSILTGMMSLSGVTPRAEIEHTSFKADFSELVGGAVADESEAAEYLESKFLFYSFQHYPDTAEKLQYFERKGVNGYLIEGENSYVFPDTGCRTRYDMDGCGALVEKGIPTWTVDGKWLYCTAYSGSDATLFRTDNIAYLRDDTPSQFAVLNNFTMETDFMFSELSDSLADGSDNLAIIFRAKSAGSIVDGNQSILSFDPNGKLLVGTSTWWETPSYNGQLKDKSNNDLKLTRGKEYRLSVTLIGQKLTLKIFDGNTEICSYESNSIGLSEGSAGGYVGLTGSNAGVKYGNIEVNRLDDNGKACDFDDYSNGYGFGMNAMIYACFRTKYVCEESKDSSDGGWWGQYYFRNSDDEYCFDYTKRNGDENAWLGYTAGAERAAAQLTELFNVYHDQNGTNGRKFAKAPEFYSHHVQSGISDGGYYGAMYIANGSRLLAFQDIVGQGLLKQTMSLVAKTSDGYEAVLENFETEFSAILFEDKEQAIALSFRSQSAGQMLKEDLSGGYADKITVYFSGTGFAVYDGTATPMSNITYTNWNNNEVFRGAVADVYVKVVGNKLIIKVTDDSGKLYYDNSESPITLTTGGGGYLYYSTCDGRGYFNDISCRRLDKDGKATEWDSVSGAEIKSIVTELNDVTIDRSNGEELKLPETLVGLDENGNKYPVKVNWVSDDYRSYLDGDFVFKPVSENAAFTFADDLEASVKVTNKINGDYDSETSRKYYFDSENDFKDFVCHYTDPDFSANSSFFDVDMVKGDASSFWKVLNGKAVSTHSRTVNTGWNGINRASDVATMVLENDNLALRNYKLEIDYWHGSDWWYPYVLYGVQDPSQFFGRVYVNPTTGDKTTGSNTDLSFNDTTKRGGVYSYVENEGNLNLWGAIQGDEYGRLIYDRAISADNTFFQNYNSSVKHHMTITVVDGTVSMKVDDSDIYYAELDDIAIGGFVGFGSCGNGVSFDNLTLTALDEFGNPTSLETAEKGAIESIPDNYKGWQPTKEEAAFDWGPDYIN